jgi:asparagine synthase (glutamine-hydrolysing)
MGSWFRSSLKDVFLRMVFRPDMDRYLSLDRVRSVWDAHQAGRQEYGRELWSILMLSCWDDRHYSRRSGELLAEAV